MNFNIRIPESAEEKIQWPTGFSDTLRGEFAGKKVSVFVIDDDGASSDVERLWESAKNIEVDPINYDRFMRLSAEALDLESHLSILVSQLNMEYRAATTRLKTKHALTYLSLTDKNGEAMAVTAAKARTTALCAEEEVEQQEIKRIIEMYLPLQGIITSTKQYLTKVLWDLNHQRNGQ